MKNLNMIVFLIFLCITAVGCSKDRSMRYVTQVAYFFDSGSILPELQKHEEIRIEQNKVTLIRSGVVADTKINTGSWNLTVEQTKLNALFDQLKTIDCAKISRVDPDEIPDGGATKTYTVWFSDGSTCELRYDPGAEYINGDFIRAAVDDFVNQLDIPSGEILDN